MAEGKTVPAEDYQEAIDSRNGLIWDIQRFVCDGRNSAARKLRDSLANKDWVNAAYQQAELEVHRSIANEIMRLIEEFQGK
jgi:hypothetical protein